MNKTSLITFFLLFLFAIDGQTQFQAIGSPSISNFPRADYHAGTQNWDIQQNQKGIIYIANNKGLLEFDGTNWQLFPLPNRTIVRSIAIDKNDRLYLGGQAEFGYLETNENGKKIYTSLTHLIPPTIQSFEDIWKIFIREDGIYFCSDKTIFHLQGEQMNIIKPKNQRFENFFEVRNKIFVQDLEEGLFQLDNQQFRPVPNGNIFPNERIIAILPHDDNQSLLFTFSNGLFMMDDVGITPWTADANDFLKTHQAYCAIEMKDGKYAVGTPQNGLLLMNRKGKPEVHLNKNVGLQNNTILSVAQDIHQNLWLGLDNGIDYTEINSPFSKITTEEGISGTGYASIVHNNKLYLGTNQGLFYTDWESDNSPLDFQKFKPVKNAVGQVWNINKLEETIIIGQHKGASILEDKQVNSFSQVQGAWKFMALQSQPKYALEGTYSGLYLYENRNYQSAEQAGKTSANWQLVRKLEGFDESARIFEEDNDGNIWVAHAYKGLYKLTPSQDFRKIEAVKLYDTSNGLPDKLLINVINIRNELVFTTPNGVYKYEKQNDRFVPHKDFEEIFGKNRNYHRLIEDELGNIWFSIDNEFGVLQVEEQGVFNKFQVLYFNQIQESLVDGFEHIHTYDENNSIIGTEKGFIHYSNLQDKNTAFPFDILIRKVSSITQGDSVIYWGNNTADTDAKANEFHYTMNDFRFEFSAPYYEKIGYLTYRFMLDGFEKEWTNWSPKTEKDYTNLPAGNYSFKVEAKNAYGQISEEATFEFKIFPPWYWSLVAKIGYFILACLGLFGLIKYISKREEKMTEAFQLEQAQKLESKEAEFKKEAEKSEGEIIKLRNEKLNTDINHKNSQLASATMHLVQKSEIMMKIKNDLKALESDAPHELKRKIQQITRAIESDIQLDNNWEQFEMYFDQVHENFFKRLRTKFPELTPKDQKLCAYLRMNLTTKEIAPLLNISVRGVEISRYRLRKKLGLNSEVNLVTFIMEV